MQSNKAACSFHKEKKKDYNRVMIAGADIAFSQRHARIPPLSEIISLSLSLSLLLPLISSCSVIRGGREARHDSAGVSRVGEMKQTRSAESAAESASTKREFAETSPLTLPPLLPRPRRDVSVTHI